MNLTETTVLSGADFPVAELRDYLRLGSGFADDGAQDQLLETCLRAAMGAIEARTSKILISRNFNWVFYDYQMEGEAMLLPVSPVNFLNLFYTYTASGVARVYSTGDFKLQLDSQRMKMVAKSGSLPKVPENGSGLIKISAGYGVWADIPANLRQAMLMLAASYYENRDVMVSGQMQLPYAVAALLAPFQRIRLRSGI